MRKAKSAVLATLSVAMVLTFAACQEEEATTGDDRPAETGSPDDEAVALNCRRELPPPPLSGGRSADLSLAIGDFGYSFTDGRHRYPHSRRFAEKSGVPVTIYRGKVCVDDGNECADACVGYRVEGGTTLVQANHHVASTRPSDRITLHYWARDDAGNFFELHREIATDGQSAEVVE